MSQDEINSLIERSAVLRGLKTRKRFYDPKTRVIPLTQANPLDRQSPLYLDLISKFQQDSDCNSLVQSSERQKRGYGETPRVRTFGAKAGQLLRESGAAVDILCEGDPSKCRVITLTLPASGHDAYKCLSDYSAEITNRILQIIRRTKDDGFHYFYCIEHQKRGALHWHICLYHGDKEVSRRLGEVIVSKWRDILFDIGRKGGIDLLFSKGFGRQVQGHEMQSLNQTMYAGCAAYFAKYAGKTAVSDSERNEKNIIRELSIKYPVSSFWGRSRNLVRLCRQHSFEKIYEGLEEEIEWKYESDMEVLSQFNLMEIKEVPFSVEIEVPFVGKKVIASGTRTIIYCNPKDLEHILAIFRFKYKDCQTSAINARAKRNIDSHQYMC
jgi:hypothetical protein